MKITVLKTEFDILVDFINESKEHLENIDSLILKIEETLNIDDINELFRKIHTIKGLSGFLEGLVDVTVLCQIVEEVLDKLRKNNIKVSSEIIEYLLKNVDIIKKVMYKLEEGLNKGEDINFEIDFDLSWSSSQKDMLIKSNLSENEISENSLDNNTKIENELDKNQEENRNLNVDDEYNKNNTSNNDKSENKIESIDNNSTIKNEYINEDIKISYQKIDKLLGLIGEIVSTKNSFSYLLKEIEINKNNEAVKKLSNQIKFIHRTADEIHAEIMNMRMIPLSGILKKYNRIVRDLAQKMGKKVALNIDCGDVVIDRNIVERLNDPLIHLIRNSIDHGIEKPKDRKKYGKDEKGNIIIKANNRGRYIEISISDDGKGIDTKKILKKAIEKGIVSKEQAKSMNDNDIINLIFYPGMSTAEVVTDISGRGVGMDVVKSTIERLKGEIEVNSEKNIGTEFKLKIPLSAALTQGVLVSFEGINYIIPMDYVEETIKINKDKIEYLIDRAAVNIRGEVIPIVPLSYALYYKDKLPINYIDEIMGNESLLPILIVKIRNEKVGIAVNSLIRNEEFVLKPLPTAIANNKIALGANIDVEGNVVIVLNPEYFNL
ncbi:chemotaxis protein CheA [Caldicellulosiruptoraceae bacterium PP1]